MNSKIATDCASVLVVDDVAVYRIAIRQLLDATDDLEVIATAKDGVDALEHIQATKPDLVTLDLEMPRLDGIGVLETIRSWPRNQRPKVVVFAAADPAQGNLTMRALQLGAADVVIKPKANEGVDVLGTTLLPRLRALITQRGTASFVPKRLSGGLDRSALRRCLVIASSTGGPQALREALSAIPPDFPAPIAVVQHIPPSFASSLVESLDSSLSLPVHTATDHMPLQPGHVYFPPGDRHLMISGTKAKPTALLDDGPAHFGLRPAADVLFASAADVFGSEVVAAVFTGMGCDGTAGARAIHHHGGAILTQTAASCVVYGMPRSVDDAGIAHCHFEPTKLATLLERFRYA